MKFKSVANKVECNWIYAWISKDQTKASYSKIIPKIVEVIQRVFTENEEPQGENVKRQETNSETKNEKEYQFCNFSPTAFPRPFNWSL